MRRLEECDWNGICRCVTCGARKPWNDGIHGGHYISRRHKATKLFSLNIWPQCIRCNKYLSGNYGEYRKFLGDRLATRLETLKHRTVQWSRYQLAKRLIIYRKRVKYWENELESRINRDNQRDFGFAG